MKSMMVLFVLCVGFLLEAASAQIKGVNEGDLIRVTAPSVSDSLITGEVRSVTQKIVRITKERLTHSWTDIPIGDIEQLEIRRVVRKTGRGALIGGGVGAFTLGFVTLASNKHCDPDDNWCIEFFTDGEAFLVGAAIGLLPGVLIGAAIGSGTKDEKWKKIPVEITSTPLSIDMHGLQNRYAAPGIKLKWSF